MFVPQAVAAPSLFLDPPCPHLPPPNLALPAASLKSALLRVAPALGSPELLRRLGVTLAVIVALRFGQLALVAGVDAALLDATAVFNRLEAQGMGTAAAGVVQGLGSVASASASATSNFAAWALASLLSLGIGPAVNASWTFAAINFLYIPGVLDSPLRRWLAGLRAGGREGEAEYNLVSKLCTAAFAAVAGWQASGQLWAWGVALPGLTAARFRGLTTLTLVAGALVARWLADVVDDHGLGEGISLMIGVGVVTSYAAAVQRLAAVLSGAGWGAARASTAASAVAAGSVALVAAAVWLTQVEVRLPLVVYRRRRASPLKGGAEGGPWATYAAWGAATEEAAAAGLPPPPPPGTTTMPMPASTASSSGAPSSAAGMQSAPPGATVVLGSADASYLPLRLTPSAMGPLLMGSLLAALLPNFVGLASKSIADALRAWLGRPVAGPLTTAGFIVLSEALATAGRDGPRAMAEWMAAAEVGVRGVPPGADTEKLLVDRTRATRLAGAAVLAALSLFAAAFDAACAHWLGAAPGSSALLLAAGFVSSAQRQVAALVAAPRLERALAEERLNVRALLGRA